MVPSGENAQSGISSVWPVVSVCRQFPVRTSHSLMVLSPEADAKSALSGLNRQEFTSLSCPVSVWRQRPSRGSHSLTVLSTLAVARSVPSGDMSTPQTQLVWPVKVLAVGGIVLLIAGFRELIYLIAWRWGHFNRETRVRPGPIWGQFSERWAHR